MRGTIILAFSVCACGGGGGGDYGDPIDSPQAQMAASTSLDQTNDLNGIRNDPGSDSALGNALGLSGSFQTMTSAKLAANPPQGLRGAPAIHVDSGCYTSDASSVTYTNCTSSDTTINGTIAWTDTTLTIDLTIETTDLDYSIDGDLTITDTMIDGYINYNWSGMQAGQSFDYSLDANYKAISLDSTGCATGGELEIHSESVGFDTWVKAEFGPNCGDVTIL